MMDYLAPKSTIGIIGTNTQAYHLARTAKQLGYRVNVLGFHQMHLVEELADQYLAVSSMHDEQAFKKLAQISDVVLYIQQQFPSRFLTMMEQFTRVIQSEAMHFLATDRSVQSVLLSGSGLDIYPYMLAVTETDIKEAVDVLGVPVSVRSTVTALAQSTIYESSPEELKQASTCLQYGPCLIEPIKENIKRLVVSSIKYADQTYNHYPITLISLDDREKGFVSAPAFLNEETEHTIYEAVETIGHLDGFMGVFSVEFILTNDQVLYVKEIMHCPHRALDYTLKSHEMTTYEALVRLAVGLPLIQHNPPLAHLIYWAFNEDQLEIVASKIKQNGRIDLMIYPNYLEDYNESHDTIGHVLMHQATDQMELSSEESDTSDND